jgi:poly(beta-D-mannuronate) lyase
MTTLARRRQGADGRSVPRHGMAAIGLSWLIALAGASNDAVAAVGDGVYTGTLICEPVGNSPGFSTPIGFVVRDGRFRTTRGTPGRDGFEEMAGTLTPEGHVAVTGTYLATGAKPIAYDGRLDETRIVASGQRGPRRCDLTVASAVPSTQARSPLVVPPEPVSRRAIVGRPARSPFACPQPPTPVVDLLVEPFYRRDDPTRSIIDPAAYEARAKAVAPLSEMASGVVRLADRHLATAPADPAIAVCLVSWLDGWARAGAMLGAVSNQGGYERKWTLVSLALAYAMVADATEPPADARARIERWLADLGWAVVPYYLRRSFAEQNNHLNWAALAGLAAGAATQDRALFAWGIEAARGALGVVAADGSLAAELRRGSKALHYHRFSVEPLALADLIAAANGVDLASWNDGALHRLAAFTLAGFDDPGLIARRVGLAQEFVGATTIRPAMFAWAEIYLARHPSPALAGRLASLRPAGGLAATWVGGNVTLRFGPVADQP